MTSTVGYARVSRRDQNPAAQDAELRAAGAVRVFVDHGESSRVKDRPQRVACLDCLRPGDTLLVRQQGQSIAHIGRVLGVGASSVSRALAKADGTTSV